MLRSRFACLFPTVILPIDLEGKVSHAPISALVFALDDPPARLGSRSRPGTGGCFR
jgi:hypothetical protein